jgi:hypothetical protein
MTGANGRRLSRRAYWLRVLKALADPVTREKWQAEAVAEPLATNGPWLKPQMASVPAAISARVVESRVVGTELRLTVAVRNTGANPAYPVQLAVAPDIYSVLWNDNYFWLAPEESVTVAGRLRLDMAGLDPITNPRVAAASDLVLSVSAWNAPAREFRVGSP